MYTLQEQTVEALKNNGREFEVLLNLVTWTENSGETVTKSYDGKSIVDFTIDEMCSSDGKLTLGAVSSAKLTIKLRTFDNIAQSQKLRPFIRLKITDGFTEWIPLGAYYVDIAKRNYEVLTLTAYDGLILAEREYITSLTFPAKMLDVVCEIADNIGFSIAENHNIADYTLNEAPWGYTCREVLGFIASASFGNAHLDRTGCFKVSGSYLTNITPDSIDKNSYTAFAETGEVCRVDRLVIQLSKTNTVQFGTGLNSVTIFNPLISKEYGQLIYNSIAGFTYTPMTLEWKGRPDIEANDVLSITARDGRVVKTVIVNNKITFNGGLSQSSSAEALSEQQTKYGEGYYSKNNAQSVGSGGSTEIYDLDTDTSQKLQYIYLSSTVPANSVGEDGDICIVRLNEGAV